MKNNSMICGVLLFMCMGHAYGSDSQPQVGAELSGYKCACGQHETICSCSAPASSGGQLSTGRMLPMVSQPVLGIDVPAQLPSAELLDTDDGREPAWLEEPADSDEEHEPAQLEEPSLGVAGDWRQGREGLLIPADDNAARALEQRPSIQPWMPTVQYETRPSSINARLREHRDRVYCQYLDDVREYVRLKREQARYRAEGTIPAPLSSTLPIPPRAGDSDVEDYSGGPDDTLFARHIKPALAPRPAKEAARKVAKEAKEQKQVTEPATEQ